MQIICLPQALDKMEAEWDPVLLEISAYKETGTYIMKSGEETAQMLDDHIVMTQVGGIVCWSVCWSQVQKKSWTPFDLTHL